jgi:hypothetical protein
MEFHVELTNDEDADTTSSSIEDSLNTVALATLKVRLMQSPVESSAFGAKYPCITTSAM